MKRLPKGACVTKCGRETVVETSADEEAVRTLSGPVGYANSVALRAVAFSVFFARTPGCRDWGGADGRIAWRPARLTGPSRIDSAPGRPRGAFPLSRRRSAAFLAVPPFLRADVRISRSHHSRDVTTFSRENSRAFLFNLNGFPCSSTSHAIN